MKKSFVSLLLALALVICLAAFAAPEAKAADDAPIQFHCKCGNKHSTALEGGEITWKEGTTACFASCDGTILQWTKFPLTSTEALQPGNYYLWDNNAVDGICLKSDTIMVGTTSITGEFNIDLNGLDFTTKTKDTNYKKAFQVGYNSTLNLCNSKVSGGTVSALGNANSHSGVVLLSNYHATTKASDQTATLNLYGVSLERLAGLETVTDAGAVRVTGNCTLNAYDCTITGGYVTKAAGALEIKANGTANLNNVNVIGGTCTAGGAILNYGTLNITGGSVTGSTVSGNGGAINNPGTMHVTDCAITGGTVTGNGGAISNSGTAVLTNVTIDGGSAEGAGGAIYSTKALTLNNVQISNTTAAGNGGAVCVGSGTFTMDGGSIIGGETTGAAKYGGNLYVGSTVTSVQIQNATIANGVSVGNAGNIYINNDSVADVDIKACTIYGGVASVDGGNLWIGTASADTIESDNNTVIISGCTIYGGTAQKGGSIVTARRTAFQGGKIGCYPVVGEDGKTTDTAAGGVAAVNGGNIFVNNCEVILNLSAKVGYGEAAASGGNVYLGGENALLTMNATSSVINGKALATIEKDTDILGGGNVFVREGAVTMGDSATITGGDAYAYGGNVCMNSGYLKLVGGSSIAGGGFTGTYGTSAKAITQKGGNVYVGANAKLQMIGTANIRNGMNADGTQCGNIYAEGEVLLGGESQVYGGVWNAKNRNIHMIGGSLSVYGSAKIDGGVTVASGSSVKLSETPTVACYRMKDGELINSDRTIYLAADVLIDATALYNNANVQLFDMAISEEGRQIATISETSDNSVRTRISIAANSTALEGYKITRERNAEGVVGLYLRKSAPVSIRETNTSLVDYLSMDAAMEAATEGQIIMINEDLDGQTVTKNVVINLVGHKLTNLTLPEGVVVYGMDTTTDDYDCSDGYGILTLAEGSQGRIEDQLKTTAAQAGAVKRYLKSVAEDGSMSFHRFYVGITKVTLKPGETGFGYKAVFCGDEEFVKLLDSKNAFGMNLWLEGSDKIVNRRMAASEFVSGKEISLLLKNFDVVNYGDTNVKANVYLKLADGTALTANVPSYSMKTMLQSLNGMLEKLSEEQITAVQSMCEDFKTLAQTWEISELLTWTKPATEPETGTEEVA